MGSEKSRPLNETICSSKKEKMELWHQQIELSRDCSAGSRDTEGDRACSVVDKNEDVDYGSSIAKEMKPEALKKRHLRSNPDIDPIDEIALSIDPREVEYPFENIVLEGGGAKGNAYIGALKCLEEVNILKQIKRFAGTSVGSIFATFLAVGYTPDELETLFCPQDQENLAHDHSWGLLSFLPNLFKTFGWNSGKKIHRWFGDLICAKTGSPDTTFYELYASRGVELCIVVTNVSLMTAQYCHVKTTTDMPIRDALRMSMSIPVVFSAVKYENYGQCDVYVDGGLLNNYPINCFDGWYLSMEREDSLITRLKSLRDLPSLMSPRNLFKKSGPNKTVGFLVYSDTETEIMQYHLEKRVGSNLPERPRQNTKLFTENEKKKKSKAKAELEKAEVLGSVEEFLKLISTHNVDEEQEYISREELKALLEDCGLSMEKKEILFGKGWTVDQAFDVLDSDRSGKIASNELIRFIEERGVRILTRIQGYARRTINSLSSFVITLQDTLINNLMNNSVTEEDEARTVGINTGHIGTMNYTVEKSDQDFLLDRGYTSTLSFLRYYAAKNSLMLTKKEGSDS